MSGREEMSRKQRYKTSGGRDGELVKLGQDRGREVVVVVWALKFRNAKMLVAGVVVGLPSAALQLGEAEGRETRPGHIAVQSNERSIEGAPSTAGHWRRRVYLTR